MVQKGTTKKHNRKRRKLRQLRPEKLLILAFALSCVFFSKIGLNSYNITLSVEEQKLASQVAEKQDEVHSLKTDISALQDKNKMLGLAGDDLNENQDNVYVINN